MAPPGDEWVQANLGRTYVSGNTRHNLFAAVEAQKLRMSTVMKVGGGAYLVNGHGQRFALKEHGRQLRFEAMIVDAEGNKRLVEFVHDSGASANIIREQDAVSWTERGDGVVYMSGFTGGEKSYGRRRPVGVFAGHGNRASAPVGRFDDDERRDWTSGIGGTRRRQGSE